MKTRFRSPDVFDPARGLNLDGAEGARHRSPTGGIVWVTQDGDLRDIVLQDGESFELDRATPAIVQAFERATVTIAAPTRSSAVARRGGLAAPAARPPRAGTRTPGLRPDAPLCEEAAMTTCDLSRCASAPRRPRAAAPYPRHLIERWALRDGTPVTIRPIRASDLPLEQAFVVGLSPATRYQRLLSGRNLLPGELRRLTDIDYAREMALIALATIDGVDADTRRGPLRPRGRHAAPAVRFRDRRRRPLAGPGPRREAAAQPARRRGR